MSCNQCPEILSGKGCTKNEPCKRQRTDLSKNESWSKENELSLTALLKGMMGILKKKA